MKSKLYATSVVAVLLAACGGGGSDDAPPVAANPPAATPPAAAPPAAPPAAPKPPPVATAPIAAPAPVTPPVTNTPVPPPAPPAGSPPSTPPPPAPPPQPAEGTYVTGKIVRAAMDSNFGATEYRAYEVNPKTDEPDPNALSVYVGFSLYGTYYTVYSYPIGYAQGGAQPHYPYGQLNFGVDFSNEGHFQLQRTLTSYNNGKQEVLIRPDGDFEIREDAKFIIDTTVAEWRGVEGKPWFVQFQVGSYSQSNTAFLLCMHESLEQRRRRACTIHDKDDGAFRGTFVIDDSRGLGAIEYRPLNQP